MGFSNANQAQQQRKVIHMVGTVSATNVTEYGELRSDLRSRWILPNSSLHKILRYVKDNGASSEASICRVLHTSQGTSEAHIFKTPINYLLCERHDVWRYIGNITPRGQHVLAVLNSGKAIDLKTLEVSTKMVEEYNHLHPLDKAAIRPETNAAKLLLYLHEGKPGVHIANIINDGKVANKETIRRLLRKFTDIGAVEYIDGLQCLTDVGHEMAVELKRRLPEYLAMKWTKSLYSVHSSIASLRDLTGVYAYEWIKMGIALSYIPEEFRDNRRVTDAISFLVENFTIAEERLLEQLMPNNISHSFIKGMPKCIEGFESVGLNTKRLREATILSKLSN